MVIVNSSTGCSFRTFTRALDSLQVRSKEVRNLDDIIGVDGLIMPGGESTTLRKLLKNTGLWKFIMESELPILGTCAGAILLGKSNDETFRKWILLLIEIITVDKLIHLREILEIENYPNFRGVFIKKHIQ